VGRGGGKEEHKGASQKKVSEAVIKRVVRKLSSKVGGLVAKPPPSAGQRESEGGAPTLSNL